MLADDLLENISSEEEEKEIEQPNQYNLISLITKTEIENKIGNDIDIEDLLEVLDLKTNKKGIAKKEKKREIAEEKNHKWKAIKRKEPLKPDSSDDDISNCSLTSFDGNVINEVESEKWDSGEIIILDDDDISDCSLASFNGKVIPRNTTAKGDVLELDYLSDISDDLIFNDETNDTKYNEKKTENFDVLAVENSTKITISNYTNTEKNSFETLRITKTSNDILEEVWDEQMENYLDDILTDPGNRN